MINPEFKKGAVKALGDLLQAKLGAAISDLEAATDARNSDTKSSAGDKHETGRAMMQMEVDNAAMQVQKMRLLKNEFDQTAFSPAYGVAEPGAMVASSAMTCLISVGIGRLPAPFETCFAISPASPMGRALIGTKPGETISFQNREIEILEIC